jgi:hypothetical protein
MGVDMLKEIAIDVVLFLSISLFAGGVTLSKAAKCGPKHPEVCAAKK